ncbi:nuclear transport factor 2 family protein [Pseudoalteromonas luteoviolacea]|uniref:DUF4440 domain-containing protein n=1 Tax=Pseudoalteromonas luteoviolacea H33 TaxID=1365251 RepID=A0A167FE46_9GAMM|nr:nuclear transport factor 2 family protein [Pseudoalteromonas luteoviolacea]KZN52118.1 hypothetical protein N476_01935 [Pseudoalteromonas luteoviolacea H33]KZN78834.1 hypothetical protein N477_08410 [Pseudoalteromonas luteoviolacea H33-S]
MKTATRYCLLFLTLLHTSISWAKTDDEVEIREVIHTYFQAFSEAKAENLHNVFLPNMDMIGNVRGKPWKFEGSKLAEGLKSREPEKLKTKIYFIDITRDSAIAKVYNVNIETGIAYTDYLFFLEVEGKWKIAHKGYTRFNEKVSK